MERSVGGWGDRAAPAVGADSGVHSLASFPPPLQRLAFMAARYCRAHFSGLHPIWRRSLLERFAEPGRLCLGILMPSRFGKIPLREKGWIFFIWCG